MDKQVGHCGDHEPSDKKSEVHSCCDQDAIPVQESHAPAGLITFFTPNPGSLAAALEISFASPDFDLLYRKTGEHLATLSILRL